jgi:hypothetical protein
VEDARLISDVQLQFACDAPISNKRRPVGFPHEFSPESSNPTSNATRPRACFNAFVCSHASCSPG